MALSLNTVIDEQGLDLLVKNAKAQLNLALAKHPKFADIIINHNIKYRVPEILRGNRLQNEEDNGDGACAFSILTEEVFEAVEAVINGNKVSARLELAQVLAMVFRIYLHLDDYLNNESQMQAVDVPD